MIGFIAVSSIALSLVTKAMAEQPSMMLSNQEKHAIDKAFEIQADRKLKSSTQYIYLGAIIYANDSDWSIWINGKRYTLSQPLTNADVKISHVEPKRIILEHDGAEIPLYPDQTFIVNDHRVVEGDARGR